MSYVLGLCGVFGVLWGVFVICLAVSGPVTAQLLTATGLLLLITAGAALTHLIAEHDS